MASKVIMYYNSKDRKQVSYIDAIGAASEIENLLPIPEKGKKITSGQTLKSSTAGLTGGA
ncbi:MAG: hypothetical protein RR224_12235 [Clostridia bacterium]